MEAYAKDLYRELPPLNGSHKGEGACLFSIGLSGVKRYIIMRPLRALPMTPQEVALWCVESHGKALEAAYGVVQVPLRLAVKFDAPYVA